MTIPADIQFASKQFDEWLGELKESAFLSTHNQGYAMLRAVLHELRDRLDVMQTAAFADGLPALIRGILYDGWRPAEAPAQLPTSHEFSDAVIRRLSPHHVPPETIVGDVFAMIARHTDAGRLAAALAHYPTS